MCNKWRIVPYAAVAGSQAAGPGQFLRASLQECHCCPLFFFLCPQLRLPTATTKEKNATHGFPRGGLVILHLALPGRGVWRRTAFFPQKPNISLLYGPDSLIQTTMSIHVPGQLGEGFFGSTTAFVASDLFYIRQKKMKSGISRFLDMLAVNLQK